MAGQIESKLAYVKRKLNDPAYNNQELCRQTGITASAISKLCSGKTVNPTYEMIEKIAEYFQKLSREK